VTEPRFAIGIDLGTSNTALCYADLREGSRPEIHTFAVPQLVAPGDVQPRDLLPSALYEPAPFELSPESTALPWRPAAERPDTVVGAAARQLGAKTAVRYVESAKSWLCHGGVNRTAKILPWHAPDDIPKRSPVEASAAYLAHLKAAWDHEMARTDESLQLDRQDVILTVPASFDEVSRRLTIEAAKAAGLHGVTLLEEPLAAFYAFVARTGGTPQATGLSPGQRILVADVGGGTSDFTLIEVNAPPEPDAPFAFERSAVGEHLLLGGDNMDLALAHAMEARLAAGNRLNPEQWAQLRLECRLAKETLFEHPSRKALPIVLAGQGSKLIGGSLRTELDRAKLEEVVVQGYFPELPARDAARPSRSRSAGLAEYGLPYATDPGITRHLAAFLLRHGEQGSAADVDAILFNGGALKPVSVRERLCGVLGAWLRATQESDRPDPRPLVYDEGESGLEMAVARGASYFGLVRRGLGHRVGGGSPRTYFLALAEPDGRAPPDGRINALCIAPRGMQDGQQVEVPDREFQLVTNRPVAFPLHATSDPRPEPVGAVVRLDPGELHALPPLKTVVRFGKQKAGTKVPVRMQARRTEVGTLEVACFSRMSGARFRLEFDLRAADVRAPATDDTPPADRSAGAPRSSSPSRGFGGASPPAPKAAPEPKAEGPAGSAPSGTANGGSGDGTPAPPTWVAEGTGEAEAAPSPSAPDATGARRAALPSSAEGGETHFASTARSFPQVRAASPRSPTDTLGPELGAGTRAPPELGDVDPERLDAAKQVLDDTFAGDAPPASAMKALEAVLGLHRDAMALPVLRSLAEHLLEHRDRRGRTPEHEARWLNLTGFCLRPGFGSAMDTWLVRQLWKVHGPGLVHPSHAANVLNWWILWRRVSGGLGRGHQEELASRVVPLLVPALHKRAKRKPPRPRTEEAAEMWRAAASLERIAAKARAQLGDAMLDLIEANKGPKGALWCMSRIGARQPLYGPRECTVRPGIALKWIDRLLSLPKPPHDGSLAGCILSLARLTRDRQLDLEPSDRQCIDDALAARDVAPDARRALFEVVQTDWATQSAAYGDALPLGLTLQA